MAFVRANPGGWAVGDVLTSAQQNALDIDHANSLDKTVAGDTLSGIVTFASTASLLCGFTDNIQATATNAIQSVASAGISSTVTSGITMAGGSFDFGGLSPARTVVRRSLMIPIGRPDVTNWDMTVAADPILVGKGLSANINLEIPTHQGATLTTVRVWLQVTNSHGAVPSIFPSFDIRRVPISSYVSSSSVQSLFSGGAQFATAATGAAWFNSGNIQQWSGTCNQNNVIDKTTYGYCMKLVDENGSYSQPSNQYIGMELTYTNITTLAFP
jgi:hypothetical protein